MSLRHVCSQRCTPRNGLKHYMGLDDRLILVSWLDDRLILVNSSALGL